MKGKRQVLLHFCAGVLVCLLGYGIGRAQQGPVRAFAVHEGLNPSHYRTLPPEQRAMYALGVVEGLYLAPFLGGSEEEAHAIEQCAEVAYAGEPGGRPPAAADMAVLLDEYVRLSKGLTAANISMHHALLRHCPATARLLERKHSYQR